MTVLSLISIISFIFKASTVSKSFSDGAVYLSTCCKDTVQSKRKVGATLLKELSRLIRSLHSAACCLCNGEEPLDASENAPAVVDNCEFIMWAGRSTQSSARPCRAAESIADGWRLSSRVDAGFSCGQAALILGSCTAGNKGGIVRLVILTSFESLCLHVLGLFFSVLLILYGCWFPPSWLSSSPDLRTLNSARSTALKSSPRKDACDVQCWPHFLREVAVQREFVALDDHHVQNMLYLNNKEINVVEFQPSTLACNSSHLNSGRVYTDKSQIWSNVHTNLTKSCNERGHHSKFLISCFFSHGQA